MREWFLSDSAYVTVAGLASITIIFLGWCVVLSIRAWRRLPEEQAHNEIPPVAVNCTPPKIGEPKSSNG